MVRAGLLAPKGVLLLVMMLQVFMSRAQTILPTTFERSLLLQGVAKDTSLAFDILCLPFSLEQEQYFLQTNGVKGFEHAYQRRKKLNKEASVQSVGWSSLGYGEYWDVNAEVSYVSNGLRLHYSLGAKYSYGNDSTFDLSYNKLFLPVNSRSRLAYMSYSRENTTIGVGRIPMNWSVYGTQGLMLSNQFWTRDGYFIRHQTAKLSFDHQTIRLDDFMSSDIRYPNEPPILAKRYYSAHRVMLNLSSKWQIAFSEAILFGGNDQVPLFQYLNPANVYFISKQSDRWGFEEDRANPVLGLDVLYANSKFGKLALQVVVDDVDFIPSLVRTYPHRYAAQINYLTYLSSRNGTLSLNVKEVSNWMYNSFYTWGNFTSYNSYLGNEMNGLTEVSARYQEIENTWIITGEVSFQVFKNQNVLEQFDASASVERENRRLNASLNIYKEVKNDFVIQLGMGHCFDFKNQNNDLIPRIGITWFW